MSEQEKQCRICLDGLDAERELGRLIRPCLCKGSISVSGILRNGPHFNILFPSMCMFNVSTDGAKRRLQGVLFLRVLNVAINTGLPEHVLLA